MNKMTIVEDLNTIQKMSGSEFIRSYTEMMVVKHLDKHYADIATEIGVSRRTVEWVVEKLRDRAQVKTNVGLLKRLIQEGYKV